MRVIHFNPDNDGKYLIETFHLMSLISSKCEMMKSFRIVLYYLKINTVDSRYLELAYLE